MNQRVNYLLHQQGLLNKLHNEVSKNVMSCVERHVDNVYLNVVFTNTKDREILAEYNVTKTIPIIDKPSNYFITVVRFDVPLNSIPLFVMPIVPNQGNPNLTPFTVFINASAVNVLYNPDNTNPAPVQNQQTQVVTPYYFVFSFDNLINSINTALAAAYIAAGSPGGAGPPFVIFNPDTQLLGLVVSVAFITAGATISVNSFLVNYFEGFRFFFNAATNIFTFILRNTGNNGFNLIGQTIPVTPGPGGPLWLIIQQEYTCMEYWLSLRKIVLVSNTIPINYEYIPAFDTSGQQTGVSSTFPILTDFIPNIEQANESRSIAVYNPTSQYRLVDLLGDTPLYNIDLKIYWQDKAGNYYPVFIEPLQQASVKIAFVRRDLYENSSNLLK